MSFSADWLARREPADLRARDGALLADLGRHFAGRERIAAVDLGCGTGSNLRAVAPVLPFRQSWLLIDHDQRLLAAARLRLAAWADEAREEDGDLRLRKGDRTIRVRFAAADLAAGVGGVVPEGTDLATAAALFDLVSPVWIEDLATVAAARRCAFYGALSYDGRDEWQPPHPADGAMLAAFAAHQGTDKGFGPAAGPAATGFLREAFARAGYRVTTAESPWRLGPDDADLVAEIAAGAAAAVRETGLVPEREIDGWLAARSSGATCLIGHTDCLALP